MSMPNARAGLSLIELVCVVMIMAMLAALAIPKLSRAAGNAPDADLRRSLAVLRLAIEMYREQHGAHPGVMTAGESFGAAGTADAFVAQLTLPTAADGRVATKAGGEFRFGPYLRHGIPACPLAPADEAKRVLVVDSRGQRSAGAEAVGWEYDRRTGHIRVNAPGRDAQGVAYRDY